MLSDQESVVAQSGAVTLLLAAIDALRDNAEADFAQVGALIGARSLGEVVELQNAFVCAQSKVFAKQAKDLGAIVTKTADESIASIKLGVEKALRNSIAS